MMHVWGYLTVGDVQYREVYHEYRGGYLDYHGGYFVGTQYRGGNHDTCGGIS